MPKQPGRNAEEGSKLRYFDIGGEQRRLASLKSTAHSDFLRTGRIGRKDNWHEEERRYLTYEEVSERTGKRLIVAGEKTIERLNGFHRSIQFPALVFHRTLSGSPHLGYCHITTAKSRFAEFSEVQWAFYIANFFAEITAEEEFFKNINMNTTSMYFAVAVQADDTEKKMVINRTVRGNGLLFRTHDPEIALKNVLMLGAKSDTMRTLIRAL